MALAGGILLLWMTMWTSACATGASTFAASTHGRASVYGSATAYVRLAPDEAFNPAVEFLLGRGDIEITELKEAENRCKAVIGDHKLTFRVIDAANRQSRMSLLVGGGRVSDANQELADTLMEQICGCLTAACEPASDVP